MHRRPDFIEKEVQLTIQVPKDFDHEDEIGLDDLFAHILEQQGWQLLKSKEYCDSLEQKEVYILTGNFNDYKNINQTNVIAVSDHPEVLIEMMNDSIRNYRQAYTSKNCDEYVFLPYDDALGKAIYSEEFDECVISFDVSRFPFLEKDKLIQKNKEENERAIDCTFISIWEDFGEIASKAKFDPITQTVFDIQMANLSDDFVELLECCSAEYIELNGKRFLLGEIQDDGTYILADSSDKDEIQTKSLNQLIGKVNKENTTTQMKTLKEVYHERF